MLQLIACAAEERCQAIRAMTATSRSRRRSGSCPAGRRAGVGDGHTSDGTDRGDEFAPPTHQEPSAPTRETLRGADPPASGGAPRAGPSVAPARASRVQRSATSYLWRSLDRPVAARIGGTAG